MDSNLTIFVCSTFEDLKEERISVLDAIRSLQLSHGSMEFFGASDNQPIETCLEEVRRSNILVVIVGHCYGSIVPETKISFSEAEYREGIRLKKPCLVYMIGEEVPILPAQMEKNPDKLRTLQAWKATLQDRHTIAQFKSESDLSIQVTKDISRTVRDFEETIKVSEEAKANSPIQFMGELKELVNNAIEKGLSQETLLSSIRGSVSAALSAMDHATASVYLSYAWTDKEIVSRVAAGLIESGVRILSSESDLKPGSEWALELERALDAANFVVFFISPSSVSSGWAKQELDAALYRQLSNPGSPHILPVLIEETEVPPLLRQIQWLNMTDGDVEKALPNLVKAIHDYSANE